MARRPLSPDELLEREDAWILANLITRPALGRSPTMAELASVLEVLLGRPVSERTARRIKAEHRDLHVRRLRSLGVADPDPIDAFATFATWSEETAIVLEAEKARKAGRNLSAAREAEVTEVDDRTVRRRRQKRTPGLN